MNKHKENIFALATPSGRSAIAVIRISGTDSFDIVKKISKNMPTIPNKATFNNIELDNKGNLTPKKLQSSAGGHVLFRVLIDCICVVSSAQKNIGDWTEGDATALQVSTSNGVPS